MRKTRASQASSSEKLMRLKQELATATDLVSAILKREQLKREASQQAKAVWEKREDFANLKRKFPSLLNAKEEEDLFYDKERVIKKPRPADQSYALSSCQVCELTVVLVALGASSSSNATTPAISCPLDHITTRSYAQRSALRQS
jgi:hypothetical protein